MSTMSPDDYVRGLYRSVLGREADLSGLTTYVELIRETADPTVVLAHLLASEEYASYAARPVLDEALIPACLACIDDRPLTIVDVGAQLLASEVHIYEPLCRRDIPHRIIGFDPLVDRVKERKTIEAGDNITLMPYAIGDGNAHTLYINNDDATSSIYPLDLESNVRFEHLNTLQTVRTLSVATVSLDQALDGEPVDFLKLDIQGAELLALKGAEHVLTRTGVIHCEVEFASIYRGQNLFPEIQSFLNDRGFSLIDILVTHRYAYVTRAGVDSRDRLLWGDAVFFRDTTDRRTVASQAMIAGLVYRKLSLAQHLHERLNLINTHSSP